MRKISIFLLSLFLIGFVPNLESKTVRIWLFGDSTVKDYFSETDQAPSDACNQLLRMAGWGEFLKYFVQPDSAIKLKNVLKADTFIIENKAIGGRSSRSYWSGSDSLILAKAFASMKPGDIMMIQFGHNDESDCSNPNYASRCASIADYRKFLGMYIDSVRKYGGTPIFVTPMVRRGWPFYNTHDDGAGKKYPITMQQLAKDRGVPCVDLTQRSIDLFNSVGDTAATYQYFRNFRTNVVLPAGCKGDGTHFQIKGGRELARQIYYGLQDLYEIKVNNIDTTKGVVTGTSNGVKDISNKYFLTVTNDFKNGSAWYEKKYNPTVKISAVAKKGFKFEGWGGDITSNDNPLTIDISKNYNITANFVAVSASQHTVLLQNDGNGSSEIAPLANFFESGSTAIIKAKAGAGSKFFSWTGDNKDTVNPVSIKVTKDLSIKAFFIEATAYIVQAENGKLSNFKSENTNKYFIGNSYVKIPASSNDSLIFYVNSVKESTPLFYFRYSNGNGQAYKADIYVNNVKLSNSVGFVSTANNDTWLYSSYMYANFKAGVNKIKFIFNANTSDLNIDLLKFVGSVAIIEAEEITGIKNFNNFDFNIIPNPSKTNTRIVFDLDKASDVSLEIFSLSGVCEKIITQKLNKPGKNTIVLPNKNLKAGAWLCKLKINGQTSVKLLIIE